MKQSYTLESPRISPAISMAERSKYSKPTLTDYRLFTTLEEATQYANSQLDKRLLGDIIAVLKDGRVSAN